MMADAAVEIEAHASGMLDVGDGQRLSWDVFGNPQGRPAVVLHGGPGSGRSTRGPTAFDPAVWRVVTYDQRGAGRSTPHASAPDADLSTNTTAHQLADLERLRAELGITRWLVHGSSWGATLALAYAQQHPDRVSALVLTMVTTTSPAEIAWIVCGVGAFFPDAHERLRAGAPEAGPDADAKALLDAYHARLMHPDVQVRDAAARSWCDWEAAIVALRPDQPPHPRYADPAFRLGFARLVTHYWRHGAWLAPDQLQRGIGRIAHVPATLVHGRLDLSGPPVTAWRLHRSWPASRLVLVDGAGHDGGDAGLRAATRAAIARAAAMPD